MQEAIVVNGNVFQINRLRLVNVNKFKRFANMTVLTLGLPTFF